MLSINNITIMGYSNGIRTTAHQERLGIDHSAGTSGGIPIMPDRYVSTKLAQGFLGKHLGYQSHIGVNLKPFTIGGSNTGTFLTTVLKSKQCEKSKACYIFTGSINPKNAAALVQF
jgi:hypothetical protein